MAKNDYKQIKIKLVRGLIGSSEAQRRVVRGLGLTKKDQVVEHYNSPKIMGMVNKVSQHNNMVAKCPTCWKSLNSLLIQQKFPTRGGQYFYYIN